MAHRKPLYPDTERSRRLNDAADAIAELLHTDYENVSTDGSNRISLTIDQAETLLALLKGAK